MPAADPGFEAKLIDAMSRPITDAGAASAGILYIPSGISPPSTVHELVWPLLWDWFVNAG